VRPEAYHLLASRQRDYWWHRARRAMCAAALRRFDLPEQCRWIDVGCGTGGNLGLIDAWRPELVAGVDLSPLALNYACLEAPGARLVRADITRGLPFADAAFDLATIFNVLYHDWVNSEVAVLREVQRVVRPGGLALITEPAFPSLAREMDVAVMGGQRYRLREFAAICRAAGFEVILSSYFTSFGAPMILAIKLSQRLLAVARPKRTAIPLDMRPLNRALNRVLFALAHAEGRAIARGHYFPFGVSLCCLCRKAG
jgi:SAM-dependent methyltransferase